MRVWPRQARDFRETFLVPRASYFDGIKDQQCPLSCFFVHTKIRNHRDFYYFVLPDLFSFMDRVKPVSGFNKYSSSVTVCIERFNVISKAKRPILRIEGTVYQ